MLHNKIDQYLKAIEVVIESVENVYIEKYLEEILTDERANLRIRLRFISGHLLEMHEAIVISNEQLEHLDYRYHFQDPDNQLIFRYDSTPHFPNLKTFPHHKHFYDQVFPSTKPALSDVIQEACTMIKNPESK